MITIVIIGVLIKQQNQFPKDLNGNPKIIDIEQDDVYVSFKRAFYGAIIVFMKKNGDKYEIIDKKLFSNFSTHDIIFGIPTEYNMLCYLKTLSRPFNFYDFFNSRTKEDLKKLFQTIYCKRKNESDFLKANKEDYINSWSK
jgi:hypothetical protein